MSMWELEALSETLVRAVAASGLPRVEQRDLMANAFALVAGFDVSFTHFRTTQLLVDAGFFHRMPVDQHPDHAARRAELDALISAGRATWLMHDDTVEAYFTPDHQGTGPSLWFDPTMALWTAAVASGQLTGPSAVPPTLLPPHQAIPRFIEVLSAAPEPDLAALHMLHGVVGYVLDDRFDVADPAWSAARSAASLREALRADQEDWVRKRFDARQALDYLEGPSAAFLSWWCEAYVD